MTAGKVIVRAAGDRQLEALASGPTGGLTLVLHNGTPAGLMAAPAIAAAAADLAAVLDALGTGEFVTVGWSGGGPHALACAALLPGRCVAAATMAGPAPHQAEGLDWSQGMSSENLAEFRAALAGPEELTRFLEPAAREMATLTGADVVAGLGDLASAADKAALTGEFADYQAASFRAAVAGGVAGWRDDDLAFVTDWGFTMADVGAGAPVAVWQGDQDMMVPWSHGHWLATHIPGARAHLLPGEGHLTLVHSFGAILDDLLDLAGHQG